jgi:hypothetical protein
MEYRHGALTIIETPRSHDSVLRDLKKIDDRLFLERQVTIEGQAVWCVVLDPRSDDPPLTILEWRDENDHPIHELGEGILYRVQKMQANAGGNLTAKVLKANHDRIEAKRREAQGHWADMGTDFERLMSPGHSAVLPRGQHLRRSRDKLRNQGWRI